MFKDKSVYEIAQDILRPLIEDGDVVVDATAGKGGDTLFLSKCVGGTGVVYAFDIQQEAVKATRELLALHNIKNVKLFNMCHSKTEEVDMPKIKAAMFNLGYLPCHDKNIITKPETTIKAIDNLLKKLKPGGMITVISYYGHNGGLSEKTALSKYLSCLEKTFTVIKISFLNRNNNPPIIFCIQAR